ncbi:septal ring lytic transglycosylase RlpA family protein [Glaesserella parasuis]|uniref:septal ring lytic transglycosylase RlpA family protein n=1 Tax=Glaesserella parasuis TaxID=738 RepID=UPI00094FFDE7|nr:septal ring lytic transglycosylase RlpA family protein [Glaesserella parasuis]MDG6346471.1 septal ring lytic transglycosylase RlpA family protein [Glaesserella parasuis]MDO9872849.1 septal ring lytic transglycosylase RlpA family protein [Glaesserella parasuis]MDO9912746.1 septal ring lytic transglycosylase RlpA family protein [Glaesserella parasuis]MDP0351536.1 septal ring lytic transglycosylase RlpA family protein [Glaesserella parasuis]MWQ32304.1 septal ring lytic transglycosylase RlpA fa
MKIGKIVTLLLAAMIMFTPLETMATNTKKQTTKTQLIVKKKSTKKVTSKKKVKKKAVSSNTKSTKTTVPSDNQTKKLYGVKGADLERVKISNNQKSYQEKGTTHTVMGKEASRQYSEVGTASYYADKFHGRRTASGEIFDKNGYTAAHKTLALGSYALITNLRNGKKVIVRINDRGPFSKTLIIDLSKGAAKVIGMVGTGTAKVRVEAMQVDKEGYIIGKGAEALYQIAQQEGLNLKVKGDGETLAIKADTEPTPQAVVSQPKFVLKVTQLKNERMAKKVQKVISTVNSHIVTKEKRYEVIIDVSSAEEAQQVKQQLNRLGYTVFSYSEK